MWIKRIIFFIILSGIIYGIYYLNNYLNGIIFYYVGLMPYIIALIFSAIAIAIPYDYYSMEYFKKQTDILSGKRYKKSKRINPR